VHEINVYLINCTLSCDRKAQRGSIIKCRFSASSSVSASIRFAVEILKDREHASTTDSSLVLRPNKGPIQAQLFCFGD
jgi:hypothetical protein